MATNNPYRATETEVMAVPEPEFTKTWHPISHARVINALTDVIINTKKAKVVNRSYTLAAKGKQMFGTWIIQNGNQDRRYMIGFRNSIDTIFAVGFCSGLHVTVCSNMMFTGEFTTFQKHTPKLDDDRLSELTATAYAEVEKKTKAFGKWHDGLRKYMMTEDQFKVTTFDAMKSGLLAPRRFGEFQDALGQEVFCDDYDFPGYCTLYNFHGAFTRMIREQSLFSISAVNNRLIGFCDDYMARMAA